MTVFLMLVAMVCAVIVMYMSMGIIAITDEADAVYNFMAKYMDQILAAVASRFLLLFVGMISWPFSSVFASYVFLTSICVSAYQFFAVTKLLG